MRWLVDWVFGDLLYRYRDSTSISLDEAIDYSRFVAEWPSGSVIIIYQRNPVPLLFVHVLDQGTGFTGVFDGPAADELWNLVCSYVGCIRGGSRGQP